MPQGSPTQPSSTHRSNTSLCMKQTSCTCESCKHETLHQTLSDTPLLPSSPLFWDDILPGICVYHHYSRPFLNKPSVRALFSFPWCEQISSQGPCTTDNGPMLHLASGITTHLASIRYRSQISAWMNWIHIPSVCSGKWCEPPEVAITDISIIHGHRSTEDCTSIKRVSFECVSVLSHYNVQWMRFGCHYRQSNLSAWSATAHD